MRAGSAAGFDSLCGCLRQYAPALALGFLVGLEADWTVLAAAGGSCAGYLLFWGPAACLEPLAGVVVGLLSTAFFAGTELRKRSWFLPALCGAITAVLGLVFLLARGAVDRLGFVGFLLRVAWCGRFCRQYSGRYRPNGVPWLTPAAGAMLVLGLCQVVWFRVLDVGLAVAAFLTCMGTGTAGLPGAVLCGLAVDLSRITPVPVTPVLCVGFLCRSLLARRSRFLSVLCPALWSLPVMYVAGTFDPCVLLGLGTGGLAAGLFPGQARPGCLGAGPLLTGDCQPFGDCRWSAGIPSGNPEPGAPQCGRARHCHLI